MRPKTKKTPPPQGKAAQMTRLQIWCAANRTHPKPRKAKGSRAWVTGWAYSARLRPQAAHLSGHRASACGSSCRTHTARRRTCQRPRLRNSGSGTREKTPYQGATPGASGIPGRRGAQAANLRRFARRFVAKDSWLARPRARATARKRSGWRRKARRTGSTSFALSNRGRACARGRGGAALSHEGPGAPVPPPPGVQARGWCSACRRLSCSRATRV